MLYLLHPRLPLRACAVGTSLGPVDVARQLAALTWRDTGEEMDSTLVSLAVRHGTPCAAGLVINHGLVALRNSVAQWQRPAPDQVSAAPFARSMDAAALEAARQFEAKLERDRITMLELAQRRLDCALAPAPVVMLVKHWEHLGLAEVGGR